MRRSVPSPDETPREFKKYEAQRSFFDELRSKVEFITCRLSLGLCIVLTKEATWKRVQ